RRDAPDDFVLERVDGDVAVRAGKLLLEMRRDCGELRPGLSQCHAGPEPREHAQAPRATFGTRLETAGSPELGMRRPEGCKAEAPRHHADDRRPLAVEQHRSAHDVALTAEPPLPQPITDHGDVCGAGLVVALRKYAPEQRPYAEHREDAR